MDYDCIVDLGVVFEEDAQHIEIGRKGVGLNYRIGGKENNVSLLDLEMFEHQVDGGGALRDDDDAALDETVGV